MKINTIHLWFCFYLENIGLVNKTFKSKMLRIEGPLIMEAIIADNCNPLGYYWH